MDEKPGKAKDREKDRSRAADKVLADPPAAAPDGAQDNGADGLRLTREVRIGLGVVAALLLVFGYVFVQKIADTDGSPTVSLPRAGAEAAADRPGGGAPIVVDDEKRNDRIGQSPDGPPIVRPPLSAADEPEHLADGMPSFLPHRTVTANVEPQASDLATEAPPTSPREAEAADEVSRRYGDADSARVDTPGGVHDAVPIPPARSDHGPPNYVEHRVPAERSIESAVAEAVVSEAVASRAVVVEDRQDRAGVRLPGVREYEPGSAAVVSPRVGVPVEEAPREQPRVRTRVYTVRAGETIYDIARRELGRVSRWKEIVALNREIVGEDIEAIEPGMKIYLPEERGGSVARGRDELPWR